MGKRLILVLAFAFFVCMTCSAFAAVQNVKVSGDLLFQGLDRKNFNLTEGQKYKNAGLVMHTRVRVDADLTDNVSATVRILNERSWGYEDVVGDITEMELDLAYAKLKEFLYSPITLTVGRQELRFGNAMIIGDIDTNAVARGNNADFPPDLSLRKSFDAVRATLDYEPLVVDVIYSKIDETGMPWWNRGILVAGQEKNDIDLYGINARYDLSALGFKGASELYFFSRVNRVGVDSAVAIGLGGSRKTDTCNTIGMLTYGQIIPKLTASLETAYQFGNSNAWFNAVGLGRANAKLSAFAIQSTVNYAFGGKYSPNVGLMYAIFSGDNKPLSKHDRAWNVMFEDQVANVITNALFTNTGVRYAVAKGDIKPWEDVTLSGVYGFYWLDRPMNNANPWGWIPSNNYGVGGVGYPPSWSTGRSYLGQALDLNCTYDYTEDVQFGLNFSTFVPGGAFDKRAGDPVYDDTATQLMGSMKVTF